MAKFKFKETIKAQECYRVIKIEKVKAEQLPLTVTDLHDVVLVDGNTFIMGAELKSFEVFKDWYINGGCETARLYEMFITKKGNKFIYWGDSEADEDYLTKYEE